MYQSVCNILYESETHSHTSEYNNKSDTCVKMNKSIKLIIQIRKVIAWTMTEVIDFSIKILWRNVLYDIFLNDHLNISCTYWSKKKKEKTQIKW